MNKSKQLNQWLWKWHIIAGLISMPVMALLCVTGAIYLFKAQFNDFVYHDERFIDSPTIEQNVSYSEQLNTAQAYTDKHIVSVTLPFETNQTTAFRVHGKGHAKTLVYIDPNTNEVTGSYNQKESFMQTVRKLHGELLLGPSGELFIELIASWVIVLALTGIYVWWPYKRFSVKGFFSIRTGKRKPFWRDMHAVIGFWMSFFLLIILAGGMPWTQLFGDNLKWVQKQTDTGYPQHWRNAKGLTSDIKFAQNKNLTALNLDSVISIASKEKLEGQITIGFPENKNGVYTITNRSMWLNDQRVIHIDQYSGTIIKSLEWNQVGILMTLRQFFMRLHQGEYGVINLVISLIVAVLLFVSTMASLVSYIIRKPKGRWGLPKVPDSFNAGFAIVIVIIVLGVIFPAFGISLLLILFFNGLSNLYKKNKKQELMTD